MEPERSAHELHYELSLALHDLVARRLPDEPRLVEHATELRPADTERVRDTIERDFAANH